MSTQHCSFIKKCCVWGCGGALNYDFHLFWLALGSLPTIIKSSANMYRHSTLDIIEMSEINPLFSPSLQEAYSEMILAFILHLWNVALFNVGFLIKSHIIWTFTSNAVQYKVIYCKYTDMARKWCHTIWTSSCPTSTPDLFICLFIFLQPRNELLKKYSLD